jgi:DNA-binding CsgD family transcriptional regulator
MQEDELLSALIADIYDTTLDAISWPQVLAKACQFVGGCACNLFSHDSLYAVAQVHYSWGDDPRYTQLYLDKYIKMNPLFPAIAFSEVGRVGVQSEIVPFDEFHETRFYQEWARPQGYVDCLFSVLERSNTGCAMVAVRRSVGDGLVDDAACRRMRLIVPHMRRAVLISRALEHSQAANAILTDVFDCMSAAVLLIGRGGGIAHVNKAGEALLAQGDILSRRGNQLIVRDQSASMALGAAFAAAQRGDAELGADGVAVPLTTATGEHHVAHVLPLTTGLRQRLGEANAAIAAVFISKRGIVWASPLEMIGKLYMLTPSEMRVLLAIVEDGGVPTVAETLGISEDTVRTHLKHLFEKTGKRRQADLVKLLAEFAHSNP